MSTKTISLEYTTKQLNNNEKPTDTGVIIVAAGSASRMCGVNKILSPLCYIPVIQRTIAAFEAHPSVKSIVIVTKEDMIADIQKIVLKADFLKVSDIVLGGASRQESVKCGFDVLSKNEDIKKVLVHDGARPLVDFDIIDRVITAADSFGAAIPAVAVKDTIKKVGAIGKVVETLERENLVNIQTPQGFKCEILKDAFFKVDKNLASFTDDSSLVESAGYPVYTVMGNYKNIKITTPEDMLIAAAYLDAEK